MVCLLCTQKRCARQGSTHARWIIYTHPGVYTSSPPIPSHPPKRVLDIISDFLLLILHSLAYAYQLDSPASRYCLLYSAHTLTHH